MMSSFYAGVGSRQTPVEILEIFKSLAMKYELQGKILRSGRAAGADSAFESGVLKDSHMELFVASDATPEAMKLAAKYHPAWYRCNNYVRKLHARNALILLGKDLQTPVDFIVCWTPNGRITGGTGQALRMAIDYGIPVINYGDLKLVQRQLELDL